MNKLYRVSVVKLFLDKSDTRRDQVFSFSANLSCTRRLILLALMFTIHLLVVVAPASAIELYTIVHKGCEAHTGLIIHVNENAVYQINIEGKLVVTDRSGIEHILVYNTIANPFSYLDLDSGLVSYIREVKVSSDDEHRFIGWPIRFLEDLIVFFDLDGRTHLVQTDTVQKFSTPVYEGLSKKKISDFHRTSFGFGRNLPACSEKASSSISLVQPTRMLSNQIKIQKFLSIYHDGFTRLNRLQKRTIFYARPYLFDTKTKIALVIVRDDFQEEFSSGFPLYFQWPSGRTFGPQGLLVVGLKPIEHLPSVEPVFNLRFDGKYHFLSASFAGNPFAFSAGGDFLIENRFFMKNFFNNRNASDYLFLPQYNQVALTGLEWGAYSLSVGYYYPLFGIQANGIFRELLSDSASPILKAQMTDEDTIISLVASSIEMGAGGADTENINLIYADEMSLGNSRTASSVLLETQLSEYRFDSSFIRVNLDIDLAQDTRVGVSQVIILGDYREVISGVPYKLSFEHYVISANAQREFGENVALKGYLNYFLRNYHSEQAQDKSNHEESRFSFSMAIEFIL
jgi:hypothetical protein